MKKILFATLVAFIVHVPASALSAFETGNTFLANSDSLQTSFVAGVVDTILGVKDEWLCLPKQVTARQLTAVSKKYLNEHPEELHLTASSLIIFSLRAAFPCK